MLAAGRPLQWTNGFTFLLLELPFSSLSTVGGDGNERGEAGGFQALELGTELAAARHHLDGSALPTQVASDGERLRYRHSRLGQDREGFARSGRVQQVDDALEADGESAG